MTNELVSRQEALAQGLPRYFTGTPCKHGHVSERYTLNKTCKDCADARSNKTKVNNPEKYLAQIAQWQRNNPEKLREYHLKYTRANAGKRNLWTSNYRQAKVDRTPVWLNDGHMFEMECVFKYCAALRNIGLDYHVDHIIPIRGARVSGLHVPWNLQVIPGRENMSKGNKFHG